MDKNGYSGTPLFKKIGLKEGYRLITVHAPEQLLDWLHPLPDGIAINSTEAADVIISFHRSADSLEGVLFSYVSILKKSGMLWVCWPKGSSGVATDLNRDYIRNYFLDHGLVDVKVASISEVWSGLKFVYRLKDR